VIVSEIGGPIELILDGVTGMKIRGRNAQELCEAMLTLMDEPTRSRMGQMARTFAVANRVDEPFSAILDSEVHRRRIEERKSAAQRDSLQLSLLELEVDFSQEEVLQS
jgi:glycosyltransferase involved in cell wall biosynthesis